MGTQPLLDAFRDYLVARHDPELRTWLDGFDWVLPEVLAAPTSLHAIRHLATMMAYVGEAERQLAQALVDCAPHLHWKQMYGPDEFGPYFTDNYAHIALIGPNGHYMSDRIAAGLVLYGPGIDYPDHWHVAEEIYIPLTGTGLWSRDGDAFTARGAGELIFHASNMRHAMKIGEAPLVALWMWHGGDLAQKADY
jgi:hypothetical protein